MGAKSAASGLLVVLVLSLTACTAVLAPNPTPVPTLTPTSSPTLTVTGDESSINGLYTVTITEEELIAGGVTDPAVLAEYAGRYNWKFSDGRWTYDQTSDKPLANPRSAGDYTLEGTHYTHYWGNKPDEITTATVTILDDRSLQFTDIVDGDPQQQAASEVTFGLHPWVRMGD
jgi:hypothetical protein